MGLEHVRFLTAYRFGLTALIANLGAGWHVPAVQDVARSAVYGWTSSIGP